MGPSVKNFVLYNIGWFAVVLFAAQGQAWIGNLAVLLVVSAHLLSVPSARKESLLLATAAIIGLVWETALVWTGVLSYPTAPGIGVLAPSWIVAMWILFATTINVSLSWVKRSWWLAALFGAIGGPLAFAAGQALGAVSFGYPMITPLVIGAGWAVLLPFLCAAADRINGIRVRDPSASQSTVGQRLSLLQQAQLLFTGKGLDK